MSRSPLYELALVASVAARLKGFCGTALAFEELARLSFEDERLPRDNLSPVQNGDRAGSGALTASNDAIE